MGTWAKAMAKREQEGLGKFSEKGKQGKSEEALLSCLESL